MALSPLVFFPLCYVVLAAAMAFGAYRRWRGHYIHLRQLELSILLKLVPIAAFAYAQWYSTHTGDDVSAYLMYALVAVTGTVLGIAWVGYDLLRLGVWGRDDDATVDDDAGAKR